MKPASTLVLIDLLALASRRATVVDLVRWSARQRDAAEKWAIAVHLRASDNIVRVPKIPRHVARLPLIADPYLEGLREAGIDSGQDR